MLWLLFLCMALLAAAFSILPLVRHSRSHTGIALLVLVLFGGLAGGIYALNGNPGVPSGRSDEPDVGAMVASLEQRLARQPDDLGGWKMLGRSYMTLGNFDAAVEAYAKAVELEDAQDAQTLVAYGEALARAGGETLSPKAIAVFENAIALAPTDPQVLFWGGIAAANRGDRHTAAERWERLLDTEPPPEVQAVLRERIAAWRGDAAAPVEDEAAGNDAPVVTVNIDVAGAARAALPANASVFVIARDPDQPSPPIAVARRLLGDLPARVALGDRDAMVPGRSLSAFKRFEVVVRASASGNPAAGPGDWYGTAIVEPASAAEVAVEIGVAVN